MGYVIIASIIFFPSILSAQPKNWNIRYYSTEDGLSSNHISSIIKDSNGIIWVGSDNGLNRFDGYSFSQLRYTSGQKHLLSQIKVLSIFEDDDDILWIGTTEGLFRFDPSEPVDQICQYQYRKGEVKNTFHLPQAVNMICEDKNGLLWMSGLNVADGFLTGLFTFNKDTETFEEIHLLNCCQKIDYDQVKEVVAIDIYCDSDGTLWLATNKGLYKYDYETNSFYCYIPTENSYSIEDNLLTLFEDSSGTIWTSTVDGVLTFDRNTECFSDPVVLHKYDAMGGMSSAAYCISEDSDGFLWMRINMGLFRVLPGPEDNSRLVIQESWMPAIHNVSTSNQLKSMLVENPRSVWIPLTEKGLCHISLHRNNFRLIEPSSFVEWTYNKPVDYVTALFADPYNNLWISTTNHGAVRYNMNSRKGKKYQMLPYNIINSIDIDSTGDLWFATKYGIHIKSVNYQDPVPEFIPYFPDTILSNTLTPRQELIMRGAATFSHYLYEHLMIKDNQGQIWFNSGKGIHDRYIPETDDFIHLDHRKIDFLNNDTLISEKEGDIWFPSMQGLLRVIPPFREISPDTYVPEYTVLYNEGADDTVSLNTNWIKAVYKSRYFEPGTIWIATIGGGLNKLVKKQIEDGDGFEIHFEHYTEADGLCDNNIFGILEDRNGNLWLSTMNGLSQFDPREKRFTNYYEEDGLPSNQFSWSEPCTGSSGEMFFPHAKGVIFFNPDSIQSNQEIPRVIITSFRIYNEAVIPGINSPIKKDIRFVDHIGLRYNQNFISFEFAALNYESPERNQYRYKFAGLDRDWIHSGTRRYAEYTDLKPGNYTFKVIGSNNNGVWNENGVALDIKIYPPPWFMWWAFAIYGLVLILMFFWIRSQFLNRLRTRRALEFEKIEREKIVEVERIKSRFFTNISHEFRTPLTLIMGHVRDLEKQQDEEVKMKRSSLAMLGRNARRLLLLINQLLDIARLEKNALQPELVRGDLSKWIRIVVSSFQSLADSQEISFIMQVEDKERKVCFDPDKTEKIVTNLLSNAFKFSEKEGSVEFVLSYFGGESKQEEYVKIEVKDSGKGMTKGQLSKIFDRFYQVSSMDTRVVEGSGIGLSLTKELIELLNGTITVESEPGKGTSFEIILPVSSDCFPGIDISEHDVQDMENSYEKEIDEVNSGGSEVVGSEEQKELIQVVEDNDDLRKYLVETLAGSYHVLEARNGKDGFEQVKKHLPEIVISDLMMPVMGGKEMTEKLKKDPVTNHIPVIMLTAKADKGSKLEGLKTGADDYLVKPFDSDELKVRVRNLIRQRKLLREKFTSEFLAEKGNKIIHLKFNALREILEAIEPYIGYPDFDLSALSNELGMTRSQLFRKIRSIADTTPNELVRMVRMRRAARLFRSTDLNVTQVMYEVGMKNPSHFAKSFKKYFRVNPADYRG